MEYVVDELRNEIAELAGQEISVGIRKEYEEEVYRLQVVNASLKKMNEKLKEEIKRLKHFEYMANSTEHERIYDIIMPPFKSAWWVKQGDAYAKEKCEKCDENRKVHFITPSGREATEPCDCSAKVKQYIPNFGEANSVYEVVSKEGAVERTYYFSNGRRTEYKYCGGEKRANLDISVLYSGGDFKKLNRNTVCFEDEETCQKYCDYLNEKEKEKPILRRRLYYANEQEK